MSRALYWQALHACGFSTFPLHAGTKTPAVEWTIYQTQRVDPSAWRDGPCNIGVATGAVSGVIVLDIDRPEAEAWAIAQGLPETLTVTTPRGKHRYYRHPGGKMPNRANLLHGQPFGIDIRGDGGYVVGPGSMYVPTPGEAAKGKLAGSYDWDWSTDIAAAPGWLLALLSRPPAPILPAVPAREAQETSTYGRAALEAEYKTLTHAQPGEVNEQINLSAFAVGQLVGGGEITDQDAREALTDALTELGVADEAKAAGTLERGYAAGLAAPRAAQRGPDYAALGLPPVSSVPPAPEPSVAAVASPRRVLTLTGEQARDKQSHLTIEWWLTASGARIRYDEFADVTRIGETALTDHLERQMWLDLRESSGLNFPKELFADTLRNMAWRERYHPVRDYLDGVQVRWDGIARLDTWLVEYLGVPDSAYSRAVGGLFLTAAARRIRRPGAKFDEMLVLEGPEGIDKSSAIAALAPESVWFSDDITVGMPSKELIEQTIGKWIVEAPELRGMTGHGVEHMKAFLARQNDRARLAYDRSTTERGRQWVAFASTNESRYLDGATGNRRIWPVRVGKVRLDDLHAARNQLWAEAAMREASGASIRLPRHLWADAAEEQDARVVDDNTLVARLDDILGERTGRVRGYDLLMACHVPVERHPQAARRLGDAMRDLGWSYGRVSVRGDRSRYYVKGDAARLINWEGGKFEYAPPEIISVI